MKTLQKLYQDAPRQTSPDALDRQILLHAQQHAERRVRPPRRFPLWMPISVSAAVACLALVLVLKPGFNQQSQPYAPSAADSSSSSTNRSAVNEPPEQPRTVEIAEQLEAQAQSTLSGSNSAASGGAAGAVSTTATIDTETDSSQAVAEVQLERQIAELSATRELALAPAADNSDEIESTALDSRKRALSRSSASKLTSVISLDDRKNDVRSKAAAPAALSSTGALSSLASAPTAPTDDNSAARAWIAAQPPTAYTIQLAVARDLENLKRDLARTALDPSLVYYMKVELREDEGHAALYGSWATINAAFNAAQEISGFQPWVRQFSELQ